MTGAAASTVVYLDSSALLKLVFEETETAALAAFLVDWPHRVSSTLARIEVTRIVARVQDAAAEREAQCVLRGVHMVRMDDDVVLRAADISPVGLRSLDAVHLATAEMFGSDLAGIVAYDRRLAAAAEAHGLTVWSPR